MDVRNARELTEMFQQVAAAAQADPETAARVRTALAESGLLDVFGAGATLDVVDLLDAGGEGSLRSRLAELSLADLRAVISAHAYDPEKTTTRWRSTQKLVDFVVEQARAQLDAERAAAASQPKALAAASWML